MTADVGRLLILIGCLITLPLIAWNVYLDRTRQNLSAVRLLMWAGFAIVMGAVAARNAVGLGWFAGPVDIVAIVTMLFGLTLINYGFLVTALAARRGQDA